MGDFVVPLVKAVQELSAKNDSLQKQNEDLEKRMEKLEAMINVQQSSTLNYQQQNITLSSASIEQNIPNPFNHTTIINYTLPQKFSSAQIIIIDNSGKIFEANKCFRSR